MASFTNDTNDDEKNINRISIDDITEDVNRITLTPSVEEINRITLTPSSSSSSTTTTTTTITTSSLEFTLEEKAAYEKTKELLKSKHKLDDKMISRRELLLCVINCKLRPENAAEKYVNWLDVMKPFDIKSFNDVWDVIGFDGKFLEGHSATKLMTAYAGCGRDIKDRSIMWIRTRPVQIAEEKDAIMASIIYFAAIHGDFKSLREGITFVLDTTENDMVTKVGNENKLQKCWQSMPLRPQRIYILGANYFKRIAINALLAFISLFTKEKVIQRIKFADYDDVKIEVTNENLPAYLPGCGLAHGLKTNDDLVSWVKGRLENFPKIPDDW